VHSALNGGLSWRGSSGLLQNSLSIVPFAAQLAFLGGADNPCSTSYYLAETRKAKLGRAILAAEKTFCYTFSTPTPDFVNNLSSFANALDQLLQHFL
jgi:hypothetical protein